MIRSLILATTLVFAVSLACAGQSPDSAPPPQSDPAKPTPASGSTQDASKDKKKPKKVWTNEELTGVNGNISVVGSEPSATSTNSTSSSNPTKDSKDPNDKDSSAKSARDKQLAAYRDQLRPLRMQFEATEKKLSELRNFKGDNTSSSGGINMNQSYSMTPMEDQIKQLEAKKIQLQDQIDSVESEARKAGFDPGDLR
jgi:chromosome segregation ATPase